MMDKVFQSRCYSHSRNISDVPYSVVVSHTLKETHLEIMTHCVDKIISLHHDLNFYILVKYFLILCYWKIWGFFPPYEQLKRELTISYNVLFQILDYVKWYFNNIDKRKWKVLVVTQMTINFILILILIIFLDKFITQKCILYHNPKMYTIMLIFITIFLSKNYKMPEEFSYLTDRYIRNIIIINWQLLNDNYYTILKEATISRFDFDSWLPRFSISSMFSGSQLNLMNTTTLRETKF